VLCEDARQCAGLPDGWADLVITSPPYANNYDYADATRLEMTFWGEINGWGDLQAAVRQHLVRSCTQHVAPYAGRTRDVLKDNLLRPVAGPLGEVCAKLEAEKDHHGGKKPYHAMIAHYFLDLAQVWKALRRVVKPGGRVCFVVGDSAPLRDLRPGRAMARPVGRGGGVSRVSVREAARPEYEVEEPQAPRVAARRPAVGGGLT
jgi:DNA modification methylase